jgi:hypothetical protein
MRFFFSRVYISVVMHNTLTVKCIAGKTHTIVYSQPAHTCSQVRYMFLCNEQTSVTVL